MNALFGTEEENGETSTSMTSGVSSRREKISEFLRDSKEKKMTSRCSIEKQQLTLMKEDLALKRKITETTNSVDQQFLENNNKMIRTMENLGNAISSCVDMMKRMHDSQHTPVRENFGLHIAMPRHGLPMQVSPPYGNVSQYYPTNCFNTYNHEDFDDQHN